MLAQYNSVNSQADAVAQTPFTQYSTDPNAFVAPLDATQQAGILGTDQAANQAQPYYDVGAGLTMAGAQAANPTALSGQDINQYLSPYLGDVLGSTEALTNQNNQQAMAGQLGNAITSGAFGGDRAGVAAANLSQQQQIAEGNVYSGIANTGYNTALSTAQQQQGVDLSAQQANLARLSSAGTQIAGLGTGAQTAALSGAQAQLAAGQTQQQTTQAGLTALYNQFLQQQGYPFQVTQFLANIAEGTGALSGSTSTTTQPSPFFSDERLKDDIEPIGKTFDGENIVKFRYKGSPQKHIGLIAQDVEKNHPEAVGLAAGFKTVDYDAATKDAAARGKSLGDIERPKLAVGGVGGGPVSLYDYANMLAAQQQGYEKAPWGQAGLYGGQPSGSPGKGSYVPSGSLPVGHLITPQSVGAQKPQSDLAQLASAAQQATQIANGAQSLGKGAQNLGSWWNAQNAGAPPPANIATDNSPSGSYARGGRLQRDFGGATNDPDTGLPYDNDNEIGIPDQQSPGTKLALAAKGVAPSSSQSSPFSQIAGLAGGLNSLVSLPGTLGTVGTAIGSAASTAGSDIMAMLPFLGLAKGGSATARHGYADGGDPDNEDQFFESLLPKDASAGVGAPAPATVPVSDNNAIPAGVAPPVNPPLPPERPKNLGDAPLAIVPRQTAAAPVADNSGQSPQAPPPDPGDYPVTRSGQEAFIRDYSAYRAGDLVARGLPPTAPLGIYGAEGASALTDKSPNAPSTVDIDPKTGQPFSFGAFQLNTRDPGALGTVALKAGINPADPSQANAANKFAIDYMADHGLAPWKGDKYVASLNAPQNGPGPASMGLGAPMQTAGQIGSGVVGGLGNIANAVTQGGKNVGDWVGQNQNWMVPLLAGLGTMASSNSRYLGSAILQGLGGAATSYENVQNQEAQRAQQQAGAQATQAETVRNAFNPAMGGLIWIKDPVTGQPRMASWQEYQQITKASGKAPEVLSGQNVPGGAGSPVISPTGAPSAVPSTQGMPTPVAPAPPAPPTPPLGVGYDADSRKTAQNDTISGPTFAQKQEQSGKYLQGTTAQADAARATVPYTQELASIISQANATGGFNAPGFGNEERAKIVNILNTLSRSEGGTGNEWGSSDTWEQIANKVNTLQGLARSQGAGQDSWNALDQLKSANPNLEQNPEAAATLAAQLMADQVKAKDRALHMQQYGEDSGGSLVNAPNDFDAKNGPQKYNRERDAVKQLILTQPKVFQAMTSGNYSQADIASTLQKKGYSPALARYFVTGG